MACTEVPAPAEYCLVAKRNHSLSSAGRQVVLASFFVVFLAISLAFATLGAWPVLPFAGLEFGMVYWAFRSIEQHSSDFESILIHGGRLVIERRERGEMSRFECNKFWAQVRCVSARPGRRAALVVRSHGKEVVFGRHLPEDKILEVAARIEQQLKNE